MTKVPESSFAPAPANADGFSLVPRKTLLTLHRTMLRVRRMDEHLLEPARQKMLFSRHTSIRGREAVIAAVVVALGSGDRLAPSRHGLVPFLIWRSGPETGRGRSHPRLSGLMASARRSAPAPSFQATLRSALEQAREQRGRVTAFFCSAGELARPAARSLLLEAGAERLPLLLIAYGGPSATGPVCRSDFPFPAIPVDSHDAVGVYRVAYEAVAHARRGNGPTLIRCLPPPFLEFEGRRSCPVANMERYLAAHKLIPNGKAAGL